MAIFNSYVKLPEGTCGLVKRSLVFLSEQNSGNLGQLQRKLGRAHVASAGEAVSNLQWIRLWHFHARVFLDLLAQWLNDLDTGVILLKLAGA